MADAIVRLRVESSEYDQKLSRATQQLQHMEKEVRRTGATFAYADKEELAMIKSLGSMETQATSAKGRMAELTKTFTELSIQYKNLTDEEKNSPFGKAMADSIGQIKGRIGDLGGQLNEVGAELKTTGGFIDTLADGLGQLGPVGQMAGKLLKGAFGPVGIAIAAVVGIVKQLVDAFKRNEDAMAGAARAAAPFKAIWQQIQRLFDRLVPYIADGMETIANGMQSLFSKITDWMGKLSQTSIGKKLGLDKVYEQLKKVSAAQAELTESNKKIADSENALNKMRRSTDTGNTQRRAQISELRFKASDKTNYSAEERVGFLEKAQELEGKTLQANLALRQKEYELIKLKNSLTKSGTEDLDAENAALNAITDARTEYNEHLRATQRQLETARKEAEKDATQGPAMPTETGATFSGPGMSNFEKLQQSIRIKLADQNFEVDESSLTNLMQVAIQNGITSLDGAFEGLQYQLGEGLNIPDEAWEELVEQINEQLEAMELPPITLDVKTGGVKEAEKEMSGLTENVQGAIGVFGQLGGAMQQLEDPGAKVAGIIMEAIANIAGTFAASLKGTATPWDWIAAAISGTAVMISTIASIKSVTSGGGASAGKFAEGGIVPGSSFSGDNLTANVNSGELILNRSQQDSIAGQLQGGATQTVVVEGRISGKDILLSANNTNRAAGGSRGYYTKVK